MYLIDIKSVRLKKFLAQQKPRYAILSHRWTEEEVTFADLESDRFDLCTTSDKFRGALNQAHRDNFDYIWVDSCCIDQRSSAELSEAINSMYQWYQQADVCYVYLQDVDADDWDETFEKSEWFTRGWTLQELLAPKRVFFYDCKWQFLGDKISLASWITHVTRVPRTVLHSGDLTPFSVAQKMPWAARRVTTRLEDLAYCLMGLFNVNMPLLYGEGKRAFIRLQEEIIKHTDDHSVFAWSMAEQQFSGMLAPAPHCFAKSQAVVPYPFTMFREPFSMTNRGLSIKLRITPWSTDTYLAYLDCDGGGKKVPDESKIPLRVGIFLRHLYEDDQYIRITFCGKDLWYDKEGVLYDRDRPVRDRQLFVRQDTSLSRNANVLKIRVYGFEISSGCLISSASMRGQCTSSSPYIASLRSGEWGCVARFKVPARPGGLRMIALGFDFDFNPICLLGDSFFPDVNDQYTQLQIENYWSLILADKMSWNKIIKDNYVYSSAGESHNGLWAIQGHRQRGLNVSVRDLLTYNKDDEAPQVSFERDEHQSQLVWKFDITSLVGPF